MSRPKMLVPALIQPFAGEAKLRKNGNLADAETDPKSENVMTPPGTICVVGRTLPESGNLTRVGAWVFYPNEPTDLEWKEGVYQEGTPFLVAQPWPPDPSQLYNFRFVRCDGGPDQEVAGGRGGSNKNWLVIWGEFEGSGQMEVIHGPERVKLISATVSSCGTIDCS